MDKFEKKDFPPTPLEERAAEYESDFTKLESNAKNNEVQMSQIRAVIETMRNSIAEFKARLERPNVSNDDQSMLRGEIFAKEQQIATLEKKLKELGQFGDDLAEAGEEIANAIDDIAEHQRKQLN